MSVIDAISARRTIRNYIRNQEVPKEDIDKIVNAALTSPSAIDFQGIDVHVIRGKDMQKKIEEKTLAALPDHAAKYFIARRDELSVDNCITCDAPVLFVFVKNERAKDIYAPIDCGIIVEAIILMAQSMGYATMCIGSIGMADLMEPLGVPKGGAIMGLAMGKPAEKQDLHDRVIKAKCIYRD